MLLSEFIKNTCGSLERLYPAQEARSLVSIYLEETLGVKNYTHIVEPSYEIPEAALEALCAGARRLAQGEPLQYVLGYADFCGHRFKVGRGVLIPRPETEQLVEMALAALKPGARVLDLCTGSGCIAWSVALSEPSAQVVGIDVSEDALAYASSQFDGPGPDFRKGNILSADWWKELGTFDLLLSNPPYIKNNEKPLMRSNVLDFEPELALFVPDEDPLVFYKAIASAAPALMNDGAVGMVEINEALGEETAAVFRAAGFAKVNVINDFCDKPRFVSFVK